MRSLPLLFAAGPAAASLATLLLCLLLDSSRGQLPSCPVEPARPAVMCTRIRDVHRFRTIDGRCNNLQHPLWGAARTPSLHLLLPQYENNRDIPDDFSAHLKPNPRHVSTSIISSPSIEDNVFLTALIPWWGQFTAHDLTLAKEVEANCSAPGPASQLDSCFNIQVPRDDPRLRPDDLFPFKRSASCTDGFRRRQVNVLTSYIDGSQIYGADEELARQIRDLASPDGQFAVNAIRSPAGREYMPFDFTNSTPCHRDRRPSAPDVRCFLSGDSRANEQLMLTVLHTITVREHNRLARRMRQLNPHWASERVYQEARKLLGALLQQITYAEWLPKIIGAQGVDTIGAYEGYQAGVNAHVANGFAVAVMRFGHATIVDKLERRDALTSQSRFGDVPLRDAFFAPWRLLLEGGVDPFLLGTVQQPAKKITGDALLNQELTEHLFPFQLSIESDLASLNIQRSRDHGTPGYNEWRRFCGLDRVTSWDDMARRVRDDRIIPRMRRMYRRPDDIDLWVGGLHEAPVPTSQLGPLFTCLLADQFKRVRDGDRFWFENPGVFTAAQVDSIRSYRLSKMICEAGDNIDRIQADVFQLTQDFVRCQDLPDVDLSLWQDAKQPKGDADGPEFFRDEPSLQPQGDLPDGDGEGSESSTRGPGPAGSPGSISCSAPNCACQYRIGVWGACDQQRREQRRHDTLVSESRLNCVPTWVVVRDCTPAQSDSASQLAS